MSNVPYPKPELSDKDAIRFWAKVDKCGPVPIAHPELGPCWEWTACTNEWDYGIFMLHGRTFKAHRIACFLLGVDIPKGLEPDHKCKNPRCVRTTHLEMITHQENLRRGWRATKQFCLNGHPLTKENTYVRRTGTKNCRICKMISLHKYRDRLRGALSAMA
jgi:HNH endonuclease